MSRPPTYREFVHVWPGPIVDRYRRETGREPALTDIFHGAWGPTFEADRFSPPVPRTTGGETGWVTAQPGVRDFYVDPNGDGARRPWLFAGYTMHLLPVLMFRPGGTDLVRAALDEPIRYGANTTVVIGLHASPWKDEHGYRCTPIKHPDYYEKIGELFDLHAERGLRCAFAIWADLQYMAPSFDARAHWRRMCGILRGRWNVFARKGNEFRANGWEPADWEFPADMGGVLCSQGSAGIGPGADVDPIVPYLDFAEYETRRDMPKAMYDAGTGMRQIMDGDTASGGPPTDRPTINVEPPFFHETDHDEYGDARWTDPKLALELGRVTSANCAGAAFGASASLEAKPLGRNAARCADAFFRGLWAGFVR